MRRIVKKMMVVMMSVCMLVTGCSKKTTTHHQKDFYDNADNIKVNVMADVLSFDVAFFTEKKVENVTLVSCNGENIDLSKMNISIVNNSMDSYANLKKDGLYCSDWLIDFQFEEDGYYRVDKLRLKVDGKDRELTFTDPLECTKESTDEAEENDFYCTVFPNGFSSEIIGTEDTFKYEFGAEKDCVFKGINALDYFNLDSAKYYLEDDEQEQQLPISLKKGEKLTVKLQYNKPDERINPYSYVLTDLEYLYEVSGKEVKRKEAVVFNPISPMDEKMKMLDAFEKYVVKD